MNEKRSVMLRVMMNRFHKSGSPESLLSCIGEKQAQEILNQSTEAHNPEAALAKPRDLLNSVHYTWLVEPITNLPTTLQPYALSSLPKKQSDALATLMQRPADRLPISSVMKQYIMNIISSELGASEILPPSFLPPHPLKDLVLLTRQQLLDIVDYLGMYDFAQDFRQIINKQQLSFLKGLLNTKQKHFLKSTLLQQDKFPIEKIGLEQYKGDIKTLMTILHRRGLVRLSKALSGCHQHLLWHLMHKIDKGRSKVIEKNWEEKPVAVYTPFIQKQVSYIFNFLKLQSKEN